MRVAIVNTFSYRPHLEHMIWLGKSYESMGYEVDYFGCSGGKDVVCNTKLYRSKVPSQINCLICKQLGLEAFGVKVNFLDASQDLGPHKDLMVGLSTLYTNERSETPCEIVEIEQDSRLELLLRAGKSIGNSFAKVLATTCYDLVLGFNGRMDLMRAIRLAAQDNNVPFVSVERPWFGNGLLCVVNSGPLDFSIVKEPWSRLKVNALSQGCAKEAIQPLVRRKLKINNAEFRVYGEGHSADSIPSQWSKQRRKILFLPSSRMEALSEIDQENVDWNHPLDALERLIIDGIFNKDEVLVRFHPVWSQEFMGKAPQKRAINYYTQRCVSLGVNIVKSDSNISTDALMIKANVVVLNGSSAFWEAGVMGKPIISLAKAWYDPFGLSLDLHTENDLLKVAEFIKGYDEKLFARYFLRALYLFQFNFTQFSNSILHNSSYDVRFGEIDQEDLSTFHKFIFSSVEYFEDVSILPGSVGEEDEVIGEYINGNFEDLVIPVDISGLKKIFPKNKLKKWLYSK